MPLVRRTLTLRVLNVKSETVGALELRVRPQPYVVDQTFRFHQSEHEFLKTTIRMAPVRWHASAPLPQPLRELYHLDAQLWQLALAEAKLCYHPRRMPWRDVSR